MAKELGSCACKDSKKVLTCALGRRAESAIDSTSRAGLMFSQFDAA